MDAIIIKHLESAKAQIKADEQSQIAIVKKRIEQEVIPFNQEVEKTKNESIANLTTKFNQERAMLSSNYNEQVVALNNKFEQDKKNIIEGSAKKIEEHLNSLVLSETYEITKKCGKAIAKIDNQIKEIKE